MKALSSDDKKGIFLILMGILFVILVVYIYVHLKQKNKYDEATLCPLEIPYEVSTIIIDKSDKWDKANALKITNLIHRTSENMQKFERLIIKVIEPNKNETPIVKTYFDMCNPGKEANPFYENPRRILEKYTKLFKEPLELLMHTFTKSGKCNSTPLFSTIKDSLDDFPNKKINFILVSDLLEHSDKFSFYGNIPTANTIIQQFKLPLDNIASIQLEYILRKDNRTYIEQSIKLFHTLSLKAHARFEKHKLMTVQ